MGFIDIGQSVGPAPTPPTPEYPKIKIKLQDGQIEPLSVGTAPDNASIDIFYCADEETEYLLDFETEIPGVTEYSIEADTLINRIPSTTIKAKVTMIFEDELTGDYSEKVFTTTKEISTVASQYNPAGLWAEYLDATEYDKEISAIKNQPATITSFKVYQYNAETGTQTDVTDKAELYGGTGVTPTPLTVYDKPNIYLKVTGLTTNPFYINYPANIRYRQVEFVPGTNAPEDPWKYSDFYNKTKAEISAYFDVKGTDYDNVVTTLDQSGQTISKQDPRFTEHGDDVIVTLTLTYTDGSFNQYYTRRPTYNLVDDRT